MRPVRADQARRRGVGFVNARKLYLLDKAGVFDDQRTEAQKKRSMDWKEG